MERILFSSDLDRTLLPNGPQPESADARALLHRLAARPEVTFAYVSGRDRQLLRAAIEEYDLPRPAFAIGDVGTTIYTLKDGEWQPWSAWETAIAADWNGLDHAALAQCLDGVESLELQEPEKQNRHKLSYYAPQQAREPVLDAVGQRLHAVGVHARLVWSVDELSGTGLLDVLPASASKLHAIRFLAAREGFASRAVHFAGDSGNDLPVLASEFPATLVANASDEVREEALALAKGNGHRDRLYLARGGLPGMNGNYAAGAVEGFLHYFPAAWRWLF